MRDLGSADAVSLLTDVVWITIGAMLGRILSHKSTLAVNRWAGLLLTAGPSPEGVEQPNNVGVPAAYVL